MTIEDFTTYTEVDASARLTVTSSKATGVNVDRDIDVYLHTDKGVDNYDDIDIDFEIRMDEAAGGSSRAGMGMTVSAISTINGFGTTDIAVIMNDSADKTVRLLRGDVVAEDFFVGAHDTTYFCTLDRTAGSDTVTLRIYSDSGRTSLLDTLSVSGYGTGTKYRHLYGFVNDNDGTANRDWDGFIQNMEDFSTGVVGAASLSGTGTLTAEGDNGRRDGAASLSGTGTLTAEGDNGRRDGVLSLSGTGLFAAMGGIIFSDAASLLAQATLIATGSVFPFVRPISEAPTINTVSIAREIELESEAVDISTISIARKVK